MINLAYHCHNFFLFSGMRPANKIQQGIELLFDFCIPQHSVHQVQQNLFATCAPTGSFGRDATGAASAAAASSATVSSCAGAAGAGLQVRDQQTKGAS